MTGQRDRPTERRVCDAHVECGYQLSSVRLVHHRDRDDSGLQLFVWSLMEHGMNLARQVRKAQAARTVTILAGEYDKADYINDLIITMISDAENGRPQPWSYYEPRVDEEFE